MLNLKHGGQFLAADAKDAQAVAKKIDSVVLMKEKPAGTPFDYLFPQLKDDPDAHLPGDPATVVDNLNALGNAMTDPSPLFESNSTIPAVYVYWGQFIDHDMTANTDRDGTVSDITKVAETGPAAPADVVKNLRNLRRPALDLDSVYGKGPAFLDAGSKDAGFYNGPRFRLGKNHEAGIPLPGEGGDKIPPVNDLDRDLPRIGPLRAAGVIKLEDLPKEVQDHPSRETLAFIGDSRNDENLIVAQFHLAFLRFHNKVVDRISGPQGKGLLDDLVGLLEQLLGGALGGLLGNEQSRRFEVARRLTRWHYQWLVVNDFLKTITTSGTVDRILTGGLKHYKPLPGGELYMPLEFSVAAYRFGHSMVRSGYDHNRNFGIRPNGFIGRASFEQLFEFTGNGHRLVPADPTKSTRSPLGGSPTLPFNWIIEWDRLTRKEDSFAPHFGKKIDTQLAAAAGTAQPTAVLNLVNEGNTTEDGPPPEPAPNPIRVLLRHLARRNLLRGYMLSIPTGQSVAAAMGVAPLTEAELLKPIKNVPFPRAVPPAAPQPDDINEPFPPDALHDPVNTAIENALRQGGFLENTPLWFYILKEAEVRGNGNCLGEVGSRIVAETIIGVLRNDPSSYLKVPGGWNPSKGVKLANGDPIVTIRDFLSFTGVPA